MSNPLTDYLNGLNSIDQIMEFVAPFEFDDGAQIQVLAEGVRGSVDFLKSHYATLLEGSDATSIDHLQRAYVAHQQRFAKLEARVTALEPLDG